MAGTRRRVAYRRKNQNRFSMFLVTLVVVMIMVVVAVKSVDLLEKIGSRTEEVQQLDIQLKAEEERSKQIDEFGKKVQTKGYIEDILCGCRFRISPKSFYQINPVQTEVLYNKAIEFANLNGDETILDTYCGIGTIGIIAAKNGAGRVIGVELNGDAVRDAITNAKANNLKNIRFFKGDAGEFMEEVALEDERPDVVFLDPPRAGSSEKFLSSLIKMSPKTVVYVSCNPETLARDLAYLQKNSDYAVRKIQPVDMFPHTAHVECVVLMTKK